MGDALNVAISVIFVFLVFSLVVSGINEGLNELFAIRSKVLWHAIDDISRHVDTPRRILRLRDVLAMPFTALRWPWRLWSKLSARWRGPEAVARRRVEDQRPQNADAREVAALERAGRMPSAQPVPVRLVESASTLLPALVYAKTRPFDSGRKRTRVKYVSPQAFSEAIIDIGVHEPVVKAARDLVGGSPGDDVVNVTAMATQPLSVGATLDETRQIGANFLADVFDAVKGTELEHPVRAAIAEANGDVTAFRASIESWFDARMQALSSAYKAWARWIMLFIGLAVAAVMNVNPITTVNELRADSALAELTAEQASAFIENANGTTLQEFCSASATNAAPGSDQLKACYKDVQGFVSDARSLPPPLEFNGLFWADGEGLLGWNGYFLGVVIGGIALSFGAPFWFDTLRRVTSLRR